MSIRFSRLAVNVKVEALAALLNGGFLDLYTSPQPASPDTALGQQIRLARLRFSDPAFTAAINGTTVAHPLAPVPSAAVSGTPAWFRAITVGGRVVIDGTVGTADGDLHVNTERIAQGAVVSIEHFSLTEVQEA